MSVSQTIYTITVYFTDSILYVSLLQFSWFFFTWHCFWNVSTMTCFRYHIAHQGVNQLYLIPMGYFLFIFFSTAVNGLAEVWFRDMQSIREGEFPFMILSSVFRKRKTQFSVQLFLFDSPTLISSLYTLVSYVYIKLCLHKMKTIIIFQLKLLLL